MVKMDDGSGAFDLKNVSFAAQNARVDRLSSLGALVSVSAWCTPGMFAPDRKKRVRPYVTERVLVAVQSIPRSAFQFATVRGRGGQLMLIASRALERSRKLRYSHDATFIYALPTEDEEYFDERLFRVEYVEMVCGRAEVLVGFAEEFQ